MKEELKKHREGKCDCYYTKTKKLGKCCYDWQVGLDKQIREAKMEKQKEETKTEEEWVKEGMVEELYN